MFCISLCRYQNLNLLCRHSMRRHSANLLWDTLIFPLWKPTNPYEFDVTLPTGYRSMDDVKKVIATISGANLTEKNVNVSEIKIINDPDGKIEVLTSVINNVVLVGEPDAIENLSVGGVIAQIDAARLSLAQGQQSVSASFIIPSTDRVFVKGSYTVSIRA